MLRFILGKSGSGKSTETLKIAGELADSNLPVMLIVPDQSTFECEKTLLDVFGAKKAEKVLVFGFSRLCKYVFELTGNSADNVIDEGTRAVVMSLALEELTEKLRLLSSKGNKSLVDVMLQTVSDLKKSSVTSDELRSASMLVCDETLKTKLNETALISDTFDALVSQSYIDPMDDLTRLNDILLNNNVLRNYTIIFDGFSGFTIQQLKVVRSLIRDCTATYFTLTLDPLTDGSEEVFATSQQTYKILKEYAKRDGTTGISYNVKKVFDVSQTNGKRPPAPTANRDPKALITTMLDSSPVNVEATNDLPYPNMAAFYNNEEQTLYVKRDVGDSVAVAQCVAQELGHAQLSINSDSYSRSDMGFQAVCIGYMLCKKYGIDTQNFAINRIPDKLTNKEPKDIRFELSKTRNAMTDIHSRVSDELYKKKQARTKDYER